jgi:hypothetical protein
MRVSVVPQGGCRGVAGGRPSAHLVVGEVRVGTAAAGAGGQAGRAHQHGEQALDAGEWAVGAAAEGAVFRRDASPTEANKRSN